MAAGGPTAAGGGVTARGGGEPAAVGIAAARGAQAQAQALPIPPPDVQATTLGVQVRDPVGARAQAQAPTGNVGPPVQLPAGQSTQNPDNVNVLDVMNQSMTAQLRKIVNLSRSLMHSPSQCKMEKLSGAISAHLEQIKIMKSAGFNTTDLEKRIKKLKGKMGELINGMFDL